MDAGYGYNANVAPATLLMSAKQLYTNISRQNECSKVDPRYAKIMALTTALEKQPSKQSHGFRGYRGSVYGGSKEETIPGMNSLKKWRTINKGPTAGVGAAGAEPVVFAVRPPRLFAAHSSCVASA